LKHVSQVRNGEPVLVSACLLGLNTRYDAASCECQCLGESLAGAWVIPVCPEQLGGLPTPRPPAEIASGDGCAVLEAGARVLAADGRGSPSCAGRGARSSRKIVRPAVWRGFSAAARRCRGWVWRRRCWHAGECDWRG